MSNSAFYSFMFDGLKMGFGSAILVTLILYVMAFWFYSTIVDFQNPLLSMMFVSIPFLAGAVIGLFSIAWGMAVAVLLMGFLFTIAITELFKGN